MRDERQCVRDERQCVRDERQFARDERQFARDERQFARGDGVSRDRRTLGPPYIPNLQLKELSTSRPDPRS